MSRWRRPTCLQVTKTLDIDLSIHEHENRRGCKGILVDSIDKSIKPAADKEPYDIDVELTQDLWLALRLNCSAPYKVNIKTPCNMDQYSKVYDFIREWT